MSKKKQPYTHIAFILDKSSSMAPLISDTVAGFNKFLEEQKSVPGKGTISRYQFNQEVSTDYEFMDLKEATELTNTEYDPGGWTALNDAVGKAILDTQAYLDSLKKARKRRPDKVYIVTTTDGEENKSTEFKDVSKLKTLIESKKDNKDTSWEFIFIGANLDAQAVAHTFSIPVGNAIGYNATSKGTEVMYMNVSTAMLRSRGTVSDDGAVAAFNFSEQERASIENSK